MMKKTNATDMIKNMVSFVDAEIILWAHSTNPFIDQNLYTDAINLFKKSLKKDSLFHNILKNHFWDQNKKPLNHNPFAKNI